MDTRSNQNITMNLKESNQLLAEVLYNDGIDLYKQSPFQFREVITQAKIRIDSILQKHFQTSFEDLDTLSLTELERIRKSILHYYRDSVEQNDVLKKWVPLGQLVGYIETLAASAYIQLNTVIDEDLVAQITDSNKNTFPLEFTRIQILNAMKRVNQGKNWEKVQDEVQEYLQESGREFLPEMFDRWKTLFEGINAPLQELYTEHVGAININESIRDLRFREEKHSQVLRNIMGTAQRNWKPENLEHDIHSQSAEVNRSAIELICNGIDANTEGTNRVDVLIQEHGYSVRDYGNGMNPYVILEKLMIPKVSGKTGKETIGRFGVGFYTVLSHLKKENDRVCIETGVGKEGHIIEFRIHERTGDVFVHMERSNKHIQGTSVIVQVEHFDPKDAEHLCKELLSYNDRSDIVVNGEKINVMEGLKKIENKTTKVKWLPEISETSHVSLLVNGISIEHFDVDGENMYKELVLDFPIACSLPESRSELAIDAVAIASINEMVINMFASAIDESQKIAICNALYPVFEILQTRVSGNKRENNLLVILQNAFKENIEMEGKVFLPNIKAFHVLHVPNAVYLHSRICTTDLEKVPGIEKCPGFESKEGYQLYVADFKDGIDEFVVEDGKRLVIDRAVYEQHKDTPAALNIYFSNLDMSGQNKKEKTKGGILNLEPIKNHETELLSSEQHRFVIDWISRASNEFKEEEIDDFMKLSENERLTRVKTKISEWCYENLDQMFLIQMKDKERERRSCHKSNKKNDLARGSRSSFSSQKEMTSQDIEEIKRKVRSVIESCDSVKSIPQKLSLLFSMENIKVRDEISVKESGMYFWLQFFQRIDYKKIFALLQQYNVLSLKNVNALMEYRESFDAETLLPIILEKYDKRDIEDLRGIIILNEFFNLQQLPEEFAEHDPWVFKEFIFYMSNIVTELQYRVKSPPSSQELFDTVQRAKYLFLKKMAHLSSNEIDEILVQFCYRQKEGYYPTLGGGYIAFYEQGNHSMCKRNIPKIIRGYITYIKEGGEILNEKGFDDANMEQVEYESIISLSTLVQAKKDNEQFFQDFSGAPAELVIYAKESQRGVDPSKAMRDVMHSTNNQIVNDGYLWIREILQNSLDAVVQNKNESGIAQRVVVDTYLRSENIHEDILWNVLYQEIGRCYPQYQNYFKGQIQQFFPTLTEGNFLEVISFLTNMKDVGSGENYFNTFTINTITKKFNLIIDLRHLDLVIEVKDPVGMNLHTVINYLLIPNESSKENDEETVGRFGQGFFTIFGDAKEVLIKTSKGDSRVEYIKITPIKDNTGAILNFSVEISEKEEDFKGTVIQKVVDTDMPEVEAAFCKSSVISYGGLINRDTVQLDFRNTEINAPRIVLAETNIPELGIIKIYDAHENAMTQNGLFIKDLDEELLSCIPENLRKIFQKNGIVLDIPTCVPLIKSRGDIASKKDIIPLLRKYIPALALRAYLTSVMLGKTELENIPYDYFESQNHRGVSGNIQSDAEKLIQGESLSSYELFLGNENALTQLLTLLPCIRFGDTTISLFELAENLDQDPNSIDITLLPQFIQDKIKHARKRKDQEIQDIKKAEHEYGIQNTIILNDRKLPDNTNLKERASVYYAYDHLVRAIFAQMNAPLVIPKYYLQIGQSSAHAQQGTNFIGFNLDYLEKQLPILSEIIEQKLPITHERVQGFLGEMIRLATHERQHNLEDSTDWTHNDVFFNGQRQVIATFIRNKGVNIQKALDEIYQDFNSSFISTKELITEMMRLQ